MDASTFLGGSNARWDDRLQAYPFFLTDISISLRVPFFVLGELGIQQFKSVSTPEMTMDTAEVVRLNSMYKVPYYTGASCGVISCTRGATPWDQTFYRWLNRSLKGTDRVQRHMLLIHFSSLRGGFLPDLFDGGGKPYDEATIFGMPRQFGRGWLLWNCVPVRYKAGSDFDAQSSELVLNEIDFQPQYFSEFTLDVRQLSDFEIFPTWKSSSTL